MKVVPLYKGCINPAMILDALQSKVKEIKNIYVIIIDDEGIPEVSCNGDLSNLCFAGAHFQKFILSKLEGFDEKI